MAISTISSPVWRRRVRRGFTLIELMIVVAIVAILARLAMPSYVDYLRRGVLPEAFTNLSDLRVKMEQYYQDNRNYGNTGGTTCANNNAPTWANFSPASAKYFTFTCALTGNSGTGNQSYTLTATGITGSRAAGHVYTINQDNAQTTTSFKGATVSKSCWLIRGSEC
jgi:type IV pilus assembly protein PilE